MQINTEPLHIPTTVTVSHHTNKIQRREAAQFAMIYLVIAGLCSFAQAVHVDGSRLDRKLNPLLFRQSAKGRMHRFQDVRKELDQSTFALQFIVFQVEICIDGSL